MKELAPIVLFVYNRPLHTQQTLEALAVNELAAESVLYIFADGIKPNATDKDIEKVEKTRQVIRNKNWCKEVHIIERDNNIGLAASVISGVTEIVNKFGRVIVLEDDLVTGSGFLRFMNDALEQYENEERVWQVSGYFFPLKNIRSSSSSFFLTFASSWGWATWQRAWKHFDPLSEGYSRLKTEKELAYHFDINGSYPYTAMLLNQMEQKNIDSWAIRWWWSIFIHNALTLFPDKSLVNNIGYDEEGTHTKYDNGHSVVEFDCNYQISSFPQLIAPDTNMLRKLQGYLINGHEKSNNQILLTKLKSFFKGNFLIII
ncbi:sugar transferase [Ferruginibacter paludis]|uniref:sugar transferase n=1 Tax=Ferruginibacter paludis TaxID=1310417 RepID=UPI0025B5B9DF|nr:sugar transferase [Ferruginibacter paludis]MDN3655874.1 sugar transferase [Ferruginibacter paludis]